MMMQAQSRINLNRRGLTELVLACAFLSLLTFALWSWRVNGGYVVALDGAAPEPQSGILPQILHHPAIILATVTTEFILLLAIVLALVPPSWWLRADTIMGTEPSESTTPLRWLGQKMHIGHVQAEAAGGQNEVNAAGEPIYYQQPGMPGVVANPNQVLPGQQVGTPVYPAQPGQPIPGQPGQMQPGQPVPGQPGQMQPGQPVPGQPVPGQPGQMQPGQPVPGQIQPISDQPAAVTQVQPGQVGVQPPGTPIAPLSDVLNFEESAEDDPLADLANIKDLLSSAFDDDGGIDPDREALGRSLDEVDILTIRNMARQMVATFIQ